LLCKQSPELSIFPNWNNASVKGQLPISPTHGHPFVLSVSINCTALGTSHTQWNHAVCLFLTDLFHLV
jgi:hypothetical protein